MKALSHGSSWALQYGPVDFLCIVVPEGFIPIVMNTLDDWNMGDWWLEDVYHSARLSVASVRIFEIAGITKVCVFPVVIIRFLISVKGLALQSSGKSGQRYSGRFLKPEHRRHGGSLIH